MQGSNRIQTADLEEVRRVERGAITERRKHAELPDQDVTVEEGKSTELVGLALSGGGLRSACFSLGVVQAFFQTGLWRYIDYLSTVSGGGYIGGFLSSYVVYRESKVEKETCPLLPRKECNLKQPPDVQRFIYGGRYLVRPWEIANKYLIGLLFVNAATFSGLVAICAAVAYVWRLLDGDSVREAVQLLGIDGLSSDAVSPFWPFFLFTGLWLMAWVISYWRQGAEAPGVVARCCLFLVVSSLLIGVAVLFGNGDADLSFLSSTPSADAWRPGNTLWASLAGITLGGLLPFLSPKRLIQSGTNPKRIWERWVFAMASTAALVGVPLLLVGYFAKEDLSGYNSNSYRPLDRGDIDKVEALLEALWPIDGEAQKLRSLNQTARSQVALAKNNEERDKAKTRVLDEIRRLYHGLPASKDTDVDAKTRVLDEIRRLYHGLPASDDTDVHSWIAAEGLKFQGDLKQALKMDTRSDASNPGVPTRLDELLEEAIGSIRSDGSSEERAVARFKLLIALQETRAAWLARRSAYLGQDRYYTFYQLVSARLRNLSEAFQHFCWNDDPQNDATQIAILTTRMKELEKQLVDLLETDVLRPKNSDEASRDLAAHLLSLHGLKQNAAGNQPVANPDSPDASKRARDKPRLQRRAALVERALHEGIDQWLPHELYELKTMLLEAEFPQVFRIRTDPQRRTTHAHDQKTRLFWLASALTVYLVLAVCLDFNATSMQRFYRMCLTKAFIVPQRNKSESPPLSGLRTTHYGSAYHLLSASTGMVLDRSGQEEIPAGRAYERHCEPDHRVVDSFLFSQLYCGSQITGYSKTEEYEKWIHGRNNRIDLAEAMALSGAAISPGHIANWFAAFLMFNMNLRLGQWIPNPRRGQPFWGPTGITLLPNLRLPARERSYCFITDGGNCENLGLVQLLRRRCSLIIQIDAGQDAEHGFADLGRAIRTARVHGGVRLVSLDDPDQDFTTESLQLTKLDPSWQQGSPGGRNCEQHFALAKILYPDDTEGLLVYVKPSFTGDESTDLQQYRRRYPEFPHEPTSDQVYDKEQAESYRQLGYHVATVLCRPLIHGHGSLWDNQLDTEQLCQAFAPNWRVKEPVSTAPGPDTEGPGEAGGVGTNGRPAGDDGAAGHADPGDDVDAGKAGSTLLVGGKVPATEMAWADLDVVSALGVDGDDIPAATSEQLEPATCRLGAVPETGGVQTAKETYVEPSLPSIHELLRMPGDKQPAILQQPEAMTRLIDALRHDHDRKLRSRVIELLEELYAPLEQHRERIREALVECSKGDASARVRQRAAKTLERIKLRQQGPK